MVRMTFCVGVIFGTIGALLLIVATIGLVQDQIRAATAHRAEGVVLRFTQSRSNNSTTFAPVVGWQDTGGKAHILISTTGSNPAASETGERVEVLYDPEKPESAKINSFGQRFGGILIFGRTGLVFSLIGGPLMYFYLRRKRVIAHLKHSGERTEAKFLRCDVDRSTVVNGRNPYIVHAQGKHPKTGRLASFKSQPIWLDLTSELEGKTVHVLFDRKRYRDHFIVLDEWVSDEETA